MWTSRCISFEGAEPPFPLCPFHPLPMVGIDGDEPQIETSHLQTTDRTQKNLQTETTFHSRTHRR